MTQRKPHLPFPGVSTEELMGSVRTGLSVGPAETVRKLMEQPEAPMTRARALEIATKHVDTMATNGRGYQDGVRFADKVAAVETLARFLIEGETEALVELPL